MQFQKQFSGQRMQLAFGRHRGTTATSLSPRFSLANAVVAFARSSKVFCLRAYADLPIDPIQTERCRAGEGGPIRTRPNADGFRKVIPATFFVLSTRLIGGFVACGEIAFSGLLLAFLSWTVARVLAGCNACARAIHPDAVEHERCWRMDDPAGGDSEFVPLRRLHKSPSGAPAVAAESIVRSEAMRVDPPDWRVSIASLWDKFRSRIRRRRARCLAIAESRALDDRSLQDVGLSRCDIERIAGQGDHSE